MMNCSLGFHMHFDHGSEYGLESLLDPTLMMLFVLISLNLLYSSVSLEAIGTIGKLCSKWNKIFYEINEYGDLLIPKKGHTWVL